MDSLIFLGVDLQIQLATMLLNGHFTQVGLAITKGASTILLLLDEHGVESIKFGRCQEPESQPLLVG